MPAQRPAPHPQLTASDLWPHLRELVDPQMLPADTWDRLEPLLPAIPGPVVGFERQVTDPAPTEVGFPLPRWHRAAALDAADGHPAADHLRPLVRAWLTDPDLDRLCDLQMHTWDVTAHGVAEPCVFLRCATDEWRPMVRAYASALSERRVEHVGPVSAAEVAERLLDAESSTPVEGVRSVGVYLGRPGCPVRLTAVAAERPWPDHPAWEQVDEVLAAARRGPRGAIVAFAPGSDPGEVWHVPVMLDRHPHPGAVAGPLLDELVARGLTSEDQATALRGIDVRRALALPSPTLDGVPAAATLWWSLERIKVVVGPEGWRSAKADMLARVIWRAVDGNVLIDH